MPCLFALAMLIAPRLMIVLLWLFTNWFNGLFDTALWPALGFVFLPTSFLWYSAVQNWNGGEWDVLQIVLLVIALSIDVSPAGGRRR